MPVTFADVKSLTIKSQIWLADLANVG